MSSHWLEDHVQALSSSIQSPPNASPTVPADLSQQGRDLTLLHLDSSKADPSLTFKLQTTHGELLPTILLKKTTGSPCLIAYATPLCSVAYTCFHNPHHGFLSSHGAFQYLFIKKAPITSPCSELPSHLG